MKTKAFKLPIRKDYVRHWGLEEAVREIIQNALDSDSEFEWKAQDSKLYIISRNSTLDPCSLLLGTTSKAENKQAIGSFGEGYKIAMLVLTRLGYDLTVYNGDYIWKPEFRMDEEYGVEVLNIIQSDVVLFKNTGLTFEIGGLNAEKIASIQESCLHMQRNVGRFKQTYAGRILLDRCGKLYVHGLYICDTELKFGYDIDPAHIALERDRKTVDNFDLKYLIRSMWFSTGETNLVAQLISDNCEDLSYANINATAEVKQACYDLFQSQHKGDTFPVKSQEQAQLARQGGKIVSFVNEVYYDNIMTSRGASENFLMTAPVAPESSAYQILEHFHEKHGCDMHEEMEAEFSSILEQSSNWKILN